MTTTDTELRVLADERDIRNLILAAWAGIDSKDWGAYASAFAQDGVFEIMGQRRTGRDAIVAGPARDLSGFERLQHIITNEFIRVEGDGAHGHWYAIAVHVPKAAAPAEHADVGLHYRFRAARGAEGWQLAEVTVELVWSSGMTFEIADHGDDA